ncbi:futalosine hydrolase [Luedemannella helvata]|uniref:Futalosine hydrolase n=1 Tax=Luedemannella helvata TaxID=349315 RepID=A0ABN2L7A0_9ACTN
MKKLGRLLGRDRVLIVTAVEVERQAILRGLGQPENVPAEEALAAGDRVVVAAAGVGVAAAAAATSRYLTIAHTAGEPFDAVINAGIAGGFADRVDVGGIVIGTRSIAADLGADSPDGFLTLDELGFGSSTMAADEDLLNALRVVLPAARIGDVLTLSTVTGTTTAMEVLNRRHPNALAEAMEGYGVATAAEQAGAAFVELRTISNPVGPRDRAAWRIPAALAALTTAAGELATVTG